MDEVFIRIRGELLYLWRAVDQDGVVLDILVQGRRNAAAAKRLRRRAVCQVDNASGCRRPRSLAAGPR